MSLYQTIGTSSPTYLLADPEGASLMAIPCEAGNGTIPRGTVMYRKASGMWAPAAAANAIITNQLAVLNEDVDTTADAKIAEDASAYRAGRLLTSRVKLAGGAVLTAAVILVLREQGIFLDQMADDAPEFANSKD